MVNFPPDLWDKDVLADSIVPLTPRMRHLGLTVEPKQFIPFLVDMPSPGLPLLQSLTLTSENLERLWFPSSGTARELPRFQNLRRVVFETTRNSELLASTPMDRYPNSTVVTLARPWAQLTSLKIIEHRLSSARIIAILTQCTTLIECELSLGYGKSTGPAYPIMLKNLNSLMLKACSSMREYSSGGVLLVLRTLALPALKTLTICTPCTFRGSLAITLSTLQQHSQFELEHFSLTGDISLQGLKSFFHGVPNVRSLCIEPCNQGAYPALLKFLKSAEDAVLPNLVALNLTAHALGMYVDTTGIPRYRSPRSSGEYHTTGEERCMELFSATRTRFPPPNESNDAESALLPRLECLVLRTRQTRRLGDGVSKGQYLEQEWWVVKARDFCAMAGALRDEGLVLEFPVEYVD